MNCLSGIDCQPSKRCPILLAASHHTVRLTDQEIPIPVEPRHEHSTLRRLNSSRLCADGAMPRQWNHEGRDEHEGVSHGTTSRGPHLPASRLLSPLRDWRFGNATGSVSDRRSRARTNRVQNPLKHWCVQARHPPSVPTVGRELVEEILCF